MGVRGFPGLLKAKVGGQDRDNELLRPLLNTFEMVANVILGDSTGLAGLQVLLR